MALISPVIRQRFTNNAGAPLVGGKLYSYAAGTSTPLATYTDSTGVSANTNPIILDSRGECGLWMSDASYKFVLKDSADSTIWTEDNVTSQNATINSNVDLQDNIIIVPTVSANSLTLTTKAADGSAISVSNPVPIAFRSATLPDGTLTKVSISTPLSATITTPSTLGHASGVSSPIYVGILTFAGGSELCWSTTPFDDRQLISTTAASAASNSATVIYSTVARTSVPVKMVTKLVSNQTTAGTWAVIPQTNITGNMAKQFVGSDGTFTPGVSFGNGTTGLTYTLRSGKFKRISPTLVHAYGYIILSAKGSSTGTARLTGLPFASDTGSEIYGEPLFIPNYSNMSTATALTGYADAGTANCVFTIPGAGSMAFATEANFLNNSTFYFSITYATTIQESNMIEWQEFLRWAFYGGLGWVAYRGVTILDQVKESIQTLNTQIAVVIEKTTQHEKRLDKHDEQIEELRQ